MDYCLSAVFCIIICRLFRYSVTGKFYESVLNHLYTFIGKAGYVHYLEFFCIQGRKEVTRVYTPGYWPLPQPIPHETTPTCVHRPPSFTLSGPPLSPYKNHNVHCKYGNSACVRTSRHVFTLCGLYAYGTRINCGFN